MRRVRYHAHGGPEVLATEEAEVPSPGPGQVLIRTEAIGVNYVDVQLRRATAPGSLYYRQLPATLTGDVVGTIEAVGPDADPSLAGTRVAVLLEDACADYVLAGTDWLVPVPSELSREATSMLPTVGAVALGTLQAGRLAKGETVLVTSGAGGIGHLAVQLARQQGAGVVIATAGSAAKLEFLAGLGADVTIDHSRPDWADEVRAVAPDGIDVVLDAVGGAMLNASIGLLRPLGRVVAYGIASGDFASIPVRSLFGLKTVTGFSLLAWRATAPERARADIAELAGLLQAGELRAVTQSLPLSEAVEAHRLLESRTFPAVSSWSPNSATPPRARQHAGDQPLEVLLSSGHIGIKTAGRAGCVRCHQQAATTTQQGCSHLAVALLSCAFFPGTAFYWWKALVPNVHYFREP
jgi:NADPH:quinone reductase